MTLNTQQLNTSAGRKIFSAFLKDNFDDISLPEKFDSLTSLYSEVNSIINISSLKAPDEIYIKHYLDSIFPYKYFQGDCCDVGCGGGFPCIPLSIVTGLDFTGIESVGKKLALIKRCVSELGVSNLSCIHARAEEAVKLGKRYDTVCARAVSGILKTLEYCVPLAKPNGRIILYKTETEIPPNADQLKKYKTEQIKALDYTLPGTEINRRLYIYGKLSC